MDVIFPPTIAQTIVFIDSNDGPGILSPKDLSNLSNLSDLSDLSDPELESFLAAPTLGSTRAGGHDDGS